MKSIGIFKRIKQEWFITFLITFLSTVLGVYYGFVLSERRIKKDKEIEKAIVIDNILDEIRNNRKDLELTIVSFNTWMNTRNLLEIVVGEPNEYLIPKSIYYEDSLNKGLFNVRDTVTQGGKIYYKGHMNYRFEIPDFSFIAYETAKYKNVLNEFGFPCLYDIESVYVKQGSVDIQMKRLLELIQQSDTEKIRWFLALSIQFCEGLLDKYNEIEILQENCDKRNETNS